MICGHHHVACDSYSTHSEAGVQGGILSNLPNLYPDEKGKENKISAECNPTNPEHTKCENLLQRGLPHISAAFPAQLSLFNKPKEEISSLASPSLIRMEKGDMTSQFKIQVKMTKGKEGKD